MCGFISPSLGSSRALLNEASRTAIGDTSETCRAADLAATPLPISEHAGRGRAGSRVSKPAEQVRGRLGHVLVAGL